MEVFKRRKRLADYALSLKHEGKTLGFTPTMGALHPGHLSLIRRSKEECDLTAASIYVNPIQFNNQQDLEKYPRTLENDLEALEKAGCDIVFTPDNEIMYPEPTLITMDFGPLGTVMEGAKRPGHFNGVGLIVAKLFHILMPHKAYFGLKDLQQVRIIQRMVSDLDFNLEIVTVDTFREPDGLAMSSRNARLNPEQRKAAPLLYQCLQEAGQMLEAYTVEDIEKFGCEKISNHDEFELEYFQVVNAQSLQPFEQAYAEKPAAICTAAFMGDLRLIDNIIID